MVRTGTLSRAGSEQNLEPHGLGETAIGRYITVRSFQYWADTGTSGPIDDSQPRPRLHPFPGAHLSDAPPFERTIHLELSSSEAVPWPLDRHRWFQYNQSDTPLPEIGSAALPHRLPPFLGRSLCPHQPPACLPHVPVFCSPPPL